MKVVSLSTSDQGHGAGIAAYRLHRALLDANVDATMLVTEKLTSDASVIDLLPHPKTFLSRLQRKTALVSERLLNVCGPQNLFSVADKSLFDQLSNLKPDIVHIHNIHWHSRNFSISLLKKIGKSVPLIWTFHDMWPITGHCIYSQNCNQWQTMCGGCPYPRAYMGQLIDSSRYQCLLKQRVYAQSKFIVVTPSRWLADCVKVSPLLRGTSIRVIPNSIDLNIYCPRSKTESRQSLGIQDVGKPAVLFAAAQLDNPLKGFRYFEEVLWRLSAGVKDNVQVFIVGKGVIDKRLKEKFSVTEFGYVTDEKRMAQIFAAADIYIMSSIYDNLPSVILESLGCGTPAVSFNTGGIPEMVRHGISGYVAHYKDVADLTHWVERLLIDENLRTEMGISSRRLVEQEYSPLVQANNYMALYKEILSKNVR